jgi:hypothetical protein
MKPNQRSVLFTIIAAMVLLAGCSQATSTPAAPLPTRLPPPFIDVLEMQFHQPAAALPDGPVSGLIGLIGAAETGETQLTLCQLGQAALACSSHPVTLDGAPAGLVKISGQASGGVLSVSQVEPLAWDEAAGQAAAQAKLTAIAEDLALYDWSTIAAPEFGESSAWFHPDIERLKGIPLELHAYDSVNDLLIWRGQGWELPQQARVVHRFPVLYIATDPTGAAPAQAFVTIEGYTEEEP